MLPRSFKKFTNPTHNRNFSTLLATNISYPDLINSNKYSYQLRSHATHENTPRKIRKAPPKHLDEVVENGIENKVMQLSPLNKSVLEILMSGNMSFGSISYEAHVTIALAVNIIACAIHGVKNIEELKQLGGYRGPMSGSGEGGEAKPRNNTLGQSRRRQIASGFFGVNGEYLAVADELEIKAGQGAKPGVGGELPKDKVTEEVAETRLTEPYITLVSPSLHHNMSSVEDLKRYIHDLRSANSNAPVAVKLVATEGIGVIVVETAKCGADVISIAGPGGTGAATLTAKHEFTIPWDTALAESHQALIAEGLRENVILTVSGGIQTTDDIVKALMLGANRIEFGTLMLVAEGCVNAKICHTGKCPKGIATTDQGRVNEKFEGKPEHVATMLIELAKSVSDKIEYYGYSHPSEIVGQTQHLKVKNNAPVKGLEDMLHKPKNPYIAAKLVKSSGSSYLEQTVIWGIASGKSAFELNASNTNLTFGARIAYHTHTDKAFAETFFTNPIDITFNGLACGQTFGFIARDNMTMTVPYANDNTGQALDGGKLYITNAAGNQTAYGATRGEIYTRFTGDHAAVRNSGAHVVCEVMGEMGCNFMTGGSVTIFGTPDCYHGVAVGNKYQSPIQLRKDIVGPNFGASFTGGRVFLPKKLYNSMYHHNYLHSHAADIMPQELSDQEINELRVRLNGYAEKISNPFIKSLLKMSDEKLKKYFIKLDPKVKRLEKLPMDSSVELLSIPQSLPSITPLKRQGIMNVALSNEVQAENKEDFSAQSEPGLYKNNREKDACGAGVIINRNGRANRKIVDLSLSMLKGFMHRGATSVDSKTGDGCGIAYKGTHNFFQKEFPGLGLKKGNYGVVHIAMPKEIEHSERVILLLDQLLVKQGLTADAQRIVPVNSNELGYIGLQSEPDFVQFIIKKPENVDLKEFETKLICIRLQFEFAMQIEKDVFRPHIISASAYHVTYKALTREDKFGAYFPDLLNKNFLASGAVDHSRFSTNTLPTFKNIQPFKFANNGENNALQLLVNLMSKDPLFKNIAQVDSIDLSGLSDSHIMSIYMDMLHLLGYTAEEIVSSTIQRYEPESDSRSSDFHNLFGVPFEGPNASIIMMNDTIITVGDKNRFRPQRGLINDDLLYIGSEYGPVEMEGDALDVPPATPFIIDMENNIAGLYVPDKSVTNFHQQQMRSLESLPSNQENPQGIKFTGEELASRKLRAGWTTELNEYFMQPMLDKEGLLSSMANQGPAEAFVQGAYNDLNAYFYGKFSQITNPPLAIKEERNYMSSKVFVGKKPALHQLGEEMVQGFELSSPIVNNDQMFVLKKSDKLVTHVIDCTFSTTDKSEDMQNRLHQLANECVDKVKAGVTLLVLSDMEQNDFHASLPPVILASFVNDALLKAGVRRNVTLALEYSSMLIGRDIAQAISIGGVDVINPYLAFACSSRSQCDAYQSALTEELLGFMARMGISTVSAYRGCKGFYSYGLDKKLAAQLGISSVLDGIGLKEIARMLTVWHQRPKPDGYSRYDLQDRKGIWSEAMKTIDVARGKENWSEVERKINQTKTGFPRGWLDFRPSQVWNRKNPMPVVIIGGGAAGLSAAKELLDSGLPVKIDIIEKNLVNPVGLIGDGVAPDHPGTKNQGKGLWSVFKDHDRVRYYPNTAFGKDVSKAALMTKYACVIDASGAANDRKLNVPGESLLSVVSASAVWKAYNNAYNPMLEPESDWHVFPQSKNDEMAIIGSGNVAADVARILLNQDLEGTTINPMFHQVLKENPPTVLHIIGVESAHQTRISLNQLQNLKKKNIQMIAHFEDQIDQANMSDEEKKLYQFFSEIKNNKPKMQFGLTVNFYFNWKAKSFEQNGDEILGVFTYLDGREMEIRAKSFIKAIGVTPDVKEDVMEENIRWLETGWCRAKAGKISDAQERAEEILEIIKLNFHQGKYNHLDLNHKMQPWQAKSTDSNQEQLNMLEYLDAGNFINTPDDVIKAKRYQNIVMQESQVDVVDVGWVERSSAKPNNEGVKVESIADPNRITVINSTTGKVSAIEPSEETLLEELKKTGEAPETDCDGGGVCAKCAVDVVEHPEKPVEFTKKEKNLYETNNLNSKLSIFSCLQKTKDLKKGVFKYSGKEDKQKEEVRINNRS